MRYINEYITSVDLLKDLGDHFERHYYFDSSNPSFNFSQNYIYGLQIVDENYLYFYTLHLKDNKRLKGRFIVSINTFLNFIVEELKEKEKELYELIVAQLESEEDTYPRIIDFQPYDLSVNVRSRKPTNRKTTNERLLNYVSMAEADNRAEILFKEKPNIIPFSVETMGVDAISKTIWRSSSIISISEM